MNKLTKKDYPKVEKLFHSLQFQLFCPAVIAGIQEGQIFVDNPLSPQTGFMITRGCWAYLAGNPNHQGFNKTLNEAIFSRRILDEQAWGLLLSCDPEGWESALEMVCKPVKPIPVPRLHYIADSMDYDWRSNIPDEYNIRLIENDLLELDEIPGDVQDMIQAWEDIDDPSNQGIGFVALHKGKIVAHAVIDCIVGTFGDIGLVTDQNHRRRGLASAVAAAAIEHGLNHGRTKVLWDAAEQNLPSIKTAEKLGLKFQEKHTMYLVDFE